MLCPVDGAELQMMERQGVEIDYCPKCRGVWLDRGELDKIIDRSTPAVPRDEPRPDRRSLQAARAEPRHREERRAYDDRDGDRYTGDRYTGARSGRKRRSFLSEIFDFD